MAIVTEQKATHLLEVGRDLPKRVVEDVHVLVHRLHNPLRVGVARVEDDVALPVGQPVEGEDLPLDEFLKNVFGVDSEGHYFGGGKQMAGGFSIPVGFLAGDLCADFTELKWQAFNAQVQSKIFRKIGVNQDLLHTQHRLPDSIPSN